MGVGTKLTSSCRYDRRRRLLIVHGREHKLSERQAEILERLARRRGALVRREELIDAVWDGNHLVGSQGLTREIHGLRRLLGDDAKSPEVILTVPRKGYRLCAPPPRTGSRLAFAAILIGGLLVTAIEVLSSAPQALPGGRVDLSSQRLVAGGDEEATQPTVSADGRVMAYATRSAASDRWELVVQRDGNNHRLRADAHLRSPQLSNDGRWLLYASERDGHCALMLVASDNLMQPRRLHDCPWARLTDWDWSGDDVVLSRRGQDSWRLVLAQTGHPEIELFSTDGQIIKPRVAPGASRIGFLETDGIRLRPGWWGDNQLRYWDIGDRSATSLAWIDDRQVVIAAHHRGPGAHTELLLANADGEVHEVATLPSLVVNLDFSLATGELVLEESGLDIDIHVIDPLGRRQLVGLHGAWDITPKLSPDGSKLLFLSDGAAGSQLVLRDLTQGTTSVLYRAGQRTLSRPTWLGDDEVSVTARAGDASRKLRISLVTRQPRELQLASDPDFAFAYGERGFLTLSHRPRRNLLLSVSDGSYADRLLEDVVALEPARDGLYYSTSAGRLFHWQDGRERLLPYRVMGRQWGFDNDRLVTLTPAGGDMWALRGHGGREIRLPSLAPRSPAAPHFDAQGGLVAVEYPQRRWRSVVRLRYDTAGAG